MSVRYASCRALAPLAHAPRAGTVVVAQLGQTLDGRIATVSGESRYISGREALAHLHRLRASVDAVVVGVGTVTADDPQLTVRFAEGANPVRVILDPNGRSPATARLLNDGAAPVLAVIGDGAEPPRGAEALRLSTDATGRFRPGLVVAALERRGLRRILIEGGAATLGMFLEAGAIDLLHLLVAPMILGSGKPGISLPPVDRLDHALRPQTDVHVFDDGDVLFTCDLRRRLEAAE
ncbi:MAG: RibD family protein [Rhodobacteraceae bacterium]|nr:MAG: RibD family protein [Paracoccaceae bacterium]